MNATDDPHSTTGPRPARPRADGESATPAVSPVARDRWRISEWLREIRARPAPAIVLGGSVNGLSFARSLGRRGIPVLLLDSERLLGTYTRYARFVRLPPPADHAAEWVDFLAYVGTRLPARGVLFITSDAHMELVSDASDAIAAHLDFLIPDRECLRRILDKRRQYEIARRAGVPIPETRFPDSTAELEEAASELAYPCILKPYTAHVGRKMIPEERKVIVARSAGELVAEYRRLAGEDAGFMVQEIIPGGDDALYGYLGFRDRRGRDRAWVTKRKLRQNPPLFGDGSLQETVRAPEVVASSRRLLDAFDVRGFVGIEFKLDRRDGSFRLMEINPRTVSGNQLPISAGVDFPWIGYRHLVGADDPDEPPPDFREGVRYVHEEWDFKAFLALRGSGGPGPREWLASLVGARARALGALDDPLPLMVVLWRFARAAARRLT